MHEGERIEPDNALYNLLLAEYYLRIGMIASSERAVSDSDRIERLKRDKGWGDEIYDRKAFALGIAELRKGVTKPYLRTYEAEINRKRLDALPPPLLTEDYKARTLITCGILFPELARYRSLARKIPACARLLHKKGHTKEAEAVLDTWKPYSLLVTRDSQCYIGARVADAVLTILSTESADFYQQIGAHAKARQAQALAAQLRDVNTRWCASRFTSTSNDMLRQHGSVLAAIIVRDYGSNRLTEQEFTPSRMHEHVMVEGFGVGLLQILFALLLLGTVAQGFIWHYQLRGAASVPLLLLPPARVIFRVLWWGVALPLLLYWLYSRLPVIGGREYGWGYLWWRFAAEFVLLGLLVLWLPARMINRYVRRRCDELGIPVPQERNEATASRVLRGAIGYAIVLAFVVLILPAEKTPLVVKCIGMLSAIALVVFGMRKAAVRRKEHGLYYGTLARSMAPLYAFAIILLALTAQPWLLYQEASWLQRDTLIFSHQATSDRMIGFTGIESRVTHDFTRQLLRVLERE